jgi:hypothetical protein
VLSSPVSNVIPGGSSGGNEVGSYCEGGEPCQQHQERHGDSGSAAYVLRSKERLSAEQDKREAMPATPAAAASQQA